MYMYNEILKTSQKSFDTAMYNISDWNNAEKIIL